MISHIAFENGQPVETQGFEFQSLDSPEDIMREKLDQGMAALDIINEYAVETAREKSREMIRAFLALIAVEKRPIYFIDQLIWLSGLAGKNGITLPELAKKHGVSKQAFEQAADRTNQHFQFPKTSAQRSSEAKNHMREAYYERV